MATSSTIQNLVNLLKSVDTETAVEVGSPERNILEVLALSIDASQINSLITSEINNLSGASLDDFLSQFGFFRRGATKASGLIKITIKNTTSTTVTLMAGSRFSRTSDSGNVYYALTNDTIFSKGDNVANAYASALAEGVSGNCTVGEIVYADIPQVQYCYNEVAFTGGHDAENDDEFRLRFLQTWEVNLAGTKGSLIGLGLKVQQNRRVRPMDVSELYQEQLQIEAGQTPSSINSNTLVYPNWQNYTSICKHVDRNSFYMFKNINTPYEVELKEGEDFDYIVNTNDPNNIYIERTAVSRLAENDIVDFQFNYTSTATRNEPRKERPTNNLIDIFCDGIQPTEIFESEVIDFKFTNNLPDHPLNSRKFMFEDNTNLPDNTPMQFLGSCPILDLPDTLMINSQEYRQWKGIPRNGEMVAISCTTPGGDDVFAPVTVEADTDGNVTATVIVYETTPNGVYEVHLDGAINDYVMNINISDTSPYRPGELATLKYGGFQNKILLGHYRKFIDCTEMIGSQRELSGFAWVHPLEMPNDGDKLNITYTYNSLPRVLDAVSETQRLCSTDQLFHRSIDVPLTINLVVWYTSGADFTSTDKQISELLKNYLLKIPFGGTVGHSDIISVIKGLPQVDEVRIAKPADSATIHDIFVNSIDGSRVIQTITKDAFRLADNELPVLSRVNIIRRSSNTFSL